jgi:hypothetical protein
MKFRMTLPDGSLLFAGGDTGGTGTEFHKAFQQARPWAAILISVRASSFNPSGTGLLLPILPVLTPVTSPQSGCQETALFHMD